MDVDDMALVGKSHLEGANGAEDEEDLLFQTGEEEAEFTTGEVEELLGDDADVEDESNEVLNAESSHQGQLQDGDEDFSAADSQSHDNATHEGHSSFRGRGGRRPLSRGLRGGRYMMRGMPMLMRPPRFFPPIPLPHSLRPMPFPPYGSRPPYMNFRSLRHARIPGGPVPPSAHMVRLPFRGVDGAYRGGGRGGVINLTSDEVTDQCDEEEEQTKAMDDKSEGPKPLMSIRTPEPVKAMFLRGRGAGGSNNSNLGQPLVIGMGMGPRYHALHRGGGAVASTPGAGLSLKATSSSNLLKRPSSSSLSSNGVQAMQIEHGEPRAKMANTNHTSALSHTATPTMLHTSHPHSSRSNLRQIQTVDDTSKANYSNPHFKNLQQRGGDGRFAYHHQHQQHQHQQHQQQQYHHSEHHQPQPRGGGPGRGAAGSFAHTAPPAPRFVVSHRPAPNLTQIQLTPSESSAPAATSSSSRPVRGVKVMIWNLPPSANFAEVSAMTTACGNVRTLNVRKENQTAIIEFSNAQSAEDFVRIHHNSLKDNCILSVRLI